MKLTHPRLLALSLASAALLLPVAVRAQSDSPAPSATPSVSSPSTGGDAEAEKHAGRHDRMAALTPDERERVKAAREKAMQDPTVKSAEAEKSTNRRAYQKAVHEAMLRADPTIKPLLEKMRSAHNHAGGGSEAAD